MSQSLDKKSESTNNGILRNFSKPGQVGTWLKQAKCICLKDKLVGGGGNRGVETCRSLYPLIPVPVLYLLAPASLHFFNCKYCAMLHNFSLFLPLPATLGIPLPAPFSPASCTPPAPFSSASRTPPAPFSPGLPPSFLPVSRPPVPPPVPPPQDGI